jgi:ectoine hydroxylase-related dioxygenase (phytanoyl-CoA dioxygenase family)
MRLTQDQLRSYDEQGFLLLPDLISPAEVDLLRAEVPKFYSDKSLRRVVEKEGYATRSVYGCHLVNDYYNHFASHPKLLEPAKQLVDDDVYIYQFKINAKVAFQGDVWKWHQDYIFWRNEDGLPAPRVTNVAIFLDEVTEFNGPLFLIPGSHREGVIEVPPLDIRPSNGVYKDAPKWITTLTADLKYSIDSPKVAELVERYGITAPKGKAGYAIFFHSNLVHASTINISPFSRTMLLITYNSVTNIPSGVDEPRPDFIAGRNYSPLTENDSM